MWAGAGGSTEWTASGQQHERCGRNGQPGSHGRQSSDRPLALQNVRRVAPQGDGDGDRVVRGHGVGGSILKRPVALTGGITRGSAYGRGIGVWDRDRVAIPAVVAPHGGPVVNDLLQGNARSEVSA